MEESNLSNRQWFAAIVCWALSIGLAVFTYLEIAHWGGGLFPTLCGLTATVCFVAGLAVIAPRFAAHVGAFLMDVWTSIR